MRSSETSAFQPPEEPKSERNKTTSASRGRKQDFDILSFDASSCLPDGTNTIGHTMPDVYQQFQLTVDLGWNRTMNVTTLPNAQCGCTAVYGSFLALTDVASYPPHTRRAVLRGLETEEAGPILSGPFLPTSPPSWRFVGGYPHPSTSTFSGSSLMTGSTPQRPPLATYGHRDPAQRLYHLPSLADLSPSLCSKRPIIASAARSTCPRTMYSMIFATGRVPASFGFHRHL